MYESVCVTCSGKLESFSYSVSAFLLNVHLHYEVLKSAITIPNIPSSTYFCIWYFKALHTYWLMVSCSCFLLLVKEFLSTKPLQQEYWNTDLCSFHFSVINLLFFEVVTGSICSVSSEVPELLWMLKCEGTGDRCYSFAWYAWRWS